MIKINFLHICDLAFIADDNKTLSVIRIFDSINSPGFPAIQAKFSVVLNISAEPGKHEYKVKIASPDGMNIVTYAEGNFLLSGNPLANIICNFVGTIFQSVGRHPIQIFIDNNLVSSGDFAIEVKKV